ncbi:MAG: hypothetical protein ACRECW_00195 [Phyllobacterium sp.]
MKKAIIASLAALSVLGLAACSDTDTTTTGSTPSEPTTQSAPDSTVTPPANNMAPAEPGAGTGGTDGNTTPAPAN